MDPNKDLDKKKKLYLIMGLLIILVLIILRSLIISQNDAIVNYRDIKEGAMLLQNAEITKSREIYYIAQDIITKLSVSYTNESGEETPIEDYYNVLNKSYRNKISKSEFLDRINTFFNKITVTDTSGMGEYTTIQTTDCIRAIYMLEKDTYVCLLGLSEGISRAFLGIKLDTDNNTYEIFYIE